MLEGGVLHYAAYQFRSAGAFRMFLRGWTKERLEAERSTAQSVLPAALMSVYVEECAYRYESPSRGGRAGWE